jgi:hypothetical protein
VRELRRWCVTRCRVVMLGGVGGAKHNAQEGRGCPRNAFVTVNIRSQDLMTQRERPKTEETSSARGALR